MLQCKKIGYRLGEYKKLKKENEKAEKTVGETGDLILCTTINNEMVQNEEVNKKESFSDGIEIKAPHTDLLPTSQEAGMMCMIDGETSFTLMKNIWVHDLGASCHFTNDD